MSRRLVPIRTVFLSTLPVRGATISLQLRKISAMISIHAPREGSDARAAAHHAEACLISIHAPREGSDLGLFVRVDIHNRISIHAPREGSDWTTPSCRKCRPRFLSTLPVRGATHAVGKALLAGQISIHAPREGSDSRRPHLGAKGQNFYPRSP